MNVVVACRCKSAVRGYVPYGVDRAAFAVQLPTHADCFYRILGVSSCDEGITWSRGWDTDEAKAFCVATALAAA